MGLEQRPLQICEITGGELCPSLLQLILTHEPRTEFDYLVLILHCLMVEAGFVGINSPDDVTVTAAAEATARPDFRLPSSVAGQLLRGTGLTSVSILYTCPKLSSPGCEHTGYVLLKVVHAGERALCHCGAAAAAGELPMVAASGLFSTLHHVTIGMGTDRGGPVEMVELAELAKSFKDCIAEPLKSALAQACGLPAPGLPSLPTELLVSILRQCDYQAVCRLGQTCRRLGTVSSDVAVWRSQMRRMFRGTFQYERAVAAELKGLGVDYREAFKMAHEERAKAARSLARRGSLELLRVLPPLTPQQQDQARSLRAHGLVMQAREFRDDGGGSEDGSGRRRNSLALTPLDQQALQVLELGQRGAGGGAGGSGGGGVPRNYGFFPPV